MFNSKLFKNAVADVIPLKQDKIIPQQPHKPILKHSVNFQFPITKSVLIIKNSYYFTDHNENFIAPEQTIDFRQSQLSNHIFQQLKRGRHKTQAKLDLHHHTVAQANAALLYFLDKSYQKKYRYLLVIHGKGQNSQNTCSLKTHVYQWLQHVHFVLSFCSALPKHGGTGALYVLLKSKK